MVIMNFDSDGIQEYGSLVVSLEKTRISFKAKEFGVLYKASRVSTSKTVYCRSTKIELKYLLPHLRYMFLGGDNNLQVIIAAVFNG